MESFIIQLNDTQSNSSSFFSSTIYSPMKYNQSDQALSIIIIAISAAAIAIPLGLMGGFRFPKIGKFKENYIKPISKKFIFPPLVGMIIMGMVSRNFFGSIMDAIPLPKAQQIKNICTSFILIRAGQQINLSGQGTLTVLMTFIPQQFEALTIAFTAYKLLNMPISFCFTLSYVISCLGPSIMVQSCMALLSEGYGKKNGVISKVIMAGTFDVVLCLINFGIVQALAYNSVGLSTGTSIGMCIANVFFQNLAGIGFGVTLSLLGVVLNRINNYQIQMTIKLLYIFGYAIMIVLVGEQIAFPNLKYIGSLFFGYITGRVWKDKLPIDHIYWAWFIIQPLFFGLVGAALVLSSLQKSIVLDGFICIITAMIVRLVSCIVITIKCGNLSRNDAIFHTLCWIPKGTVQAALGGVVLADSVAQNNSEIKQYGQTILTVSILAIMLFSPIGAILINSLGPQLLDKEEKQNTYTFQN